MVAVGGGGYPEGFPRASWDGGPRIYADEPIWGLVADRDYDVEGPHDRWRVTVTVNQGGTEAEAFSAVVYAFQPFDLQGALLPFLDWGIDFASPAVVSPGTGAIYQPLRFTAVSLADPSVSCTSESRKVVHARWNRQAAGRGFLDYARANRIFLTHRKLRYVTPESPEYLTWVAELALDGFPTAYLKCRVFYSSGSVGMLDLGEVPSTCNIACGPRQLGLAGGEEVDSYEVFLADASGGPLSERIAFVVDYGAYPSRRHLVFRNSLGGFDTLLFTGELSSTFEVSGTTSVGYQGGTVKLRKEAVNVARVVSARSGALPASDLPYVASELLTTERAFLVEGGAITELVLEDGTYEPNGEDPSVIDLELHLRAANVGEATLLPLSMAAPEVPNGIEQG